MQVCAAYFKKAQQRGELKVEDAVLAGQQLRALLEAEWLDSLLYGDQLRPTKRQIRESAKRAVDAFIASYGANTTQMVSAHGR